MTNGSTLLAALAVAAIVLNAAAANDCPPNYKCVNGKSSGFSDVPTADRSRKRGSFARTLIVRCGEFGFRCNMAKLDKKGNVYASDGLIRTRDDEQSNCYIKVGPVSKGGRTFQGCELHGTAQTSTEVGASVTATVDGPEIGTSWSASFETRSYKEQLNCAVWCGSREYTKKKKSNTNPSHLLDMGTYIRCYSSGKCTKNQYLKFRRMYKKRDCKDGILGSGVSPVRVWYDTWPQQSSYCYQNV